MKRTLVAFPVVVLCAAVAAQADQVVSYIPQAKSMAQTSWRPDAQLVTIQVAGYDVELSPDGKTVKPDNTPKLVYFHFYSPSDENDYLVVSQPFNFPPEQKDIVRQHPELGSMRSQVLRAWTTTPLRNALPDEFMSVNDDVALAQKSNLQADCAGTNANYGCADVKFAELHMYIVGSGQMLPIWRIRFGQDARAKEITRLVNASSGRLITNCSVPDLSQSTDRENLYLRCY